MKGGMVKEKSSNPGDVTVKDHFCGPDTEHHLLDYSMHANPALYVCFYGYYW